MKWKVPLLGGLVLLFSPLLLLEVSAEPARFDNYRFYDVRLETEDQLEVFLELSTTDIFFFMYDPYTVGQHLKVGVSPQQLPIFEDLVAEYQLKTRLLVSDVQQLINKSNRKSRSDGFALDEFNRLDVMYEWLDTLPEKYPGVVTRVKGGDSHEGRSIEGVKLSRSPNNPAIVIESNIHGAEWITSSSVLWIVNELLTSTDPEVQALTEKYNWYMFPVTNPDGYEFSHTTNRMWRKTRSRNGLICWGTDPNRNWSYEWVDKREPITNSSSTDDVCWWTYSGGEPFSQIETRSFRDFLITIQDEIKIYLSFHSAAKMILAPWGYTGDKPEHFDDLMEMAAAAADRLKTVHGQEYIYGSLHDILSE